MLVNVNLGLCGDAEFGGVATIVSPRYDGVEVLSRVVCMAMGGMKVRSGEAIVLCRRHSNTKICCSGDCKLIERRPM